NLRLERIQALLARIGNPERSFKSVHVGGTSGKGSTCYLISSILTAAGYKTGLHVSPHLEYIGERIQINGVAITQEDFAVLVSWIRPFVEEVEKTGSFGTPTYFEVLVSLAFEHFRRSGVEIAVVEVGLGGERDATNVLAPPVAVLTNVDLDHTEILGNTVEEIARDKAGIIKQGMQVISAAKQPSVREIIENRCREKNALLMLIGRDVTYSITASNSNGSRFSITTSKKNYTDLTISLLGRHQIENAACAVAAVEALEETRVAIAPVAFRQGLAACRVPGRMEIISRSPLIVLDGAHNPAKMRALVDAIREIFPDKKISCVFGAKTGKDVASMLDILAPLIVDFRFTQSSAVTDTGKSTGMDPAALAELLYAKGITAPIACTASPHEALKKARATLADDGLVLITGSLYVVGEVRTLLRQEKQINTSPTIVYNVLR
ncbi:MAG: folylpolyglutamate synthase/dihydrofolate synthase family protein, partial [Candidatus Sungbacteria bacterium]|nr:folylpolyglutamate synthase/dihydrofolate synthase family protein [Candidatus Sungbacteria bacterium]